MPDMPPGIFCHKSNIFEQEIVLLFYQEGKKNLINFTCQQNNY